MATRAIRSRAGLFLTVLIVATIAVACTPGGSASQVSAPPAPVSTGVTETGQKAYCARLPQTGDTMWSLVSGVVPTPTVSKGPTDPVYPAGIEQQVEVCIQQTGQTRLECREDIRRGNLSGPP